MASSQKDVVYIDVDDEITAIIDKVRGSTGKIIALVLPKRATVMQSIVNMKLLKRTATEAKKHLVLITSEAGLLPLAGIVGLHVAPSLQSKPEIPEATPPADTPVSVDEEEVDAANDTPPDPKKSIGELAGLPGFKKLTRRSSESDNDDAIEVDNEDEIEPEKTTADTTATTTKPAYDKKLRVPDFERFRTRMFIAGAALVLLLVGWFVAFQVLPKATITIKTDNVSVNSNLNLVGSVSAKSVDEQQMIVPATLKESKKTDTQKVPATGQKDMGTKASGSVTLSLTDCSSPQVTVPAGTTVASGNLNFITQADATLTSVKFGTQCRNSDFPQVSTAKVSVQAQNAGDQYNLSARTYSVAGFSNVTAQGSSMSGGTSKVVKIVSQQDVDGAKQKILDANNSGVSQDIAKQLKDAGYIALADTLVTGSPLVTASPNVGDEANDVTVTVATTYTMYGVKQDAVTQLLEKDIKQHIDTSKQNILNNGLDKAVIRVSDKNDKQVKFSLQAVAAAGVQQDSDAIKKAVAGKKRGEVQSIISARPGVKDVNVSYSPMWVYSTPSNVGKITIIFQQSDGNTTQ